MFKIRINFVNCEIIKNCCVEFTNKKLNFITFKIMNEGNSVYEAAHQGDYETVAESVSKDKKLVTQPDSNSRLLIHWASLGGNVQLVTLLIDLQTPIDPVDDTDTTPLILAASAGKTNIVEVLIKNKANVNQKNDSGHSALQYACSKGWDMIVQTLLENNADINIADVRGATPLHRAASKGNLSTVKLLISYEELKIDERDFYGNSALHLACEEDRQEEAKLLVQNGADLKLLNKECLSPLDLCTRGLAKILLDLTNK